MKSVLLLFAVVGVSAFGTLTDPRQIEKQLANASLVADIEVEALEGFSDSTYGAKNRATARVLRIHSLRDDGGWYPAQGETVVVESLGGEFGETGVYYAGYPRPYNGWRYRASLVRDRDQVFKIAGLEEGLVPLDKRRAYSRNRTDGSNGAGSGPFLYWDPTYFPIPYFISAPTFRNQPQFLEEIDQSFKPWRDPGEVALEFVPMGCTSTVLNRNDGINALILVTHDWVFDPTAIAITRNFYVSGTGAKAGLILDTDIMINAVNHEFTATGEPAKNDIRNILTHEVGHFIGLGHEVDPKDTLATMYGSALPGETNKRSLARNDLSALHAGYSGVGQKFASFSSSNACPVGWQGLSCLSVHKGPRAPSYYVWLFGMMALALALGRIWTRDQEEV